MRQFSDFSEFLVYDENNQPLGIKQDAPQDIKLEYRRWYLDEMDKQRMYDLFHNE